MADFVGAFFRGRIDFFFQVMFEGLVKLLSWRGVQIILGTVATIAVFYFALPDVSA